MLEIHAWRDHWLVHAGLNTLALGFAPQCPYAAVKIGNQPTARAPDLSSSVEASRRDMTICHATAVAGSR